ncbi:YrhA family protein [Priestia aryabhattai]|uniref:YrhA family protein n=1 Tax=Priestia megaterium TaxID=1404 RepID=UPI0039B8A9BF
MPEWKDLLREIEKVEEKYGSSLRSPASDREIMELNHNIQEKLGSMALPEPYIEFLKKVNGLDFNGLVIYGVDKALLDKEVDEDIYGFIEANELWYENGWQKQYIFLGDSDTAWYFYDLKESLYVELDKPSGTLIQSFENFDSLLGDAFETVIL